ncbi:MAG: Fic family protein [Nitrospira sp.]|nr:Fic family protein [Nitrospira sp.]
MNQQSYTWKRIDDLPSTWKDLANSQIEALVAAWQEQAKQLRGKDSYNEFLRRLRRQWAIETGILERLYSLSEGATKTLIEKGLDAAFIGHEDTDRNPSDVLIMIQDQHAAIEGLYQFISGQRPLGTSYIKELHQTLTEHQVHYHAKDTLGQEVVRALPKGEWKKLPNNVEGPGNFKFEFCPPEHVDSEMDLLLQLHEVHEGKWHVPPYVEAAWLHHAFTLIHPFTDGNGRVARCLASLVFLKHNWFPLVVTRGDREDYISALRQADRGDLRKLINLFVTLQGRAVREAFSLSEDLAYEQIAIGNILEAVKGRFARLKQEHEIQKQQVFLVADTLQSQVSERLNEVANEVTDAIAGERKGFTAYSANARRNDPKAGYNYYQIVACAKALGYFANLEVYQAWADLTILTGTRTEILFAFHGMGNGSTGVIACSAMYYTKQASDSGETMIGEVTPLSDEPFTLTYKENPTEVNKKFTKWVNDRIILGLDRWRKALGA